MRLIQFTLTGTMVACFGLGVIKLLIYIVTRLT